MKLTKSIISNLKKIFWKNIAPQSEEHQNNSEIKKLRDLEMELSRTATAFNNIGVKVFRF